MAQLCEESEKRGEAMPIWHASAIVHGHLEKCQCAICIKSTNQGERRIVITRAELNRICAALAEQSKRKSAQADNPDLSAVAALDMSDDAAADADLSFRLIKLYGGS